MTKCRAAVTLTSVEDPSSGDEAVVVLRGGWDFTRRLVFRNPVFPEAFETSYATDLVRCIADVHDSGLEAHATVSTHGGDGLVEYLRGLAADFRGWEGSRRWRNLDDQLRVEATHDGLGHVTVLFRLREGWSYPYDDHWDLSIPFTVEAGAEMLTLADAFEIFFTPPAGHKIPNMA